MLQVIKRKIVYLKIVYLYRGEGYEDMVDHRSI